jgi:DNA-binding response OmpR family regulator
MTARIVCFVEDEQLIAAAERALTQSHHSFHLFPARDLSADVRQMIHYAKPDLFLLELSPSLSNLHLFVFLRSDEVTRSRPIILLSADTQIDQHAAALNAEASLQIPATSDQISDIIAELLPDQLAFSVGAHRTRMAAHIGYR